MTAFCRWYDVRSDLNLASKLLALHNSCRASKFDLFMKADYAWLYLNSETLTDEDLENIDVWNRSLDDC